MAKVIAIHEYELLPGVSVEAVDRLLAATPFPTLAGWKTSYAKGERGERIGKYIMIHEFESTEIRDRYFPSEGGEAGVEVQDLFTNPDLDAFVRAWDKLATPLLKAVYTDYIEIS